ncbi:MAG: hypothetical protein R3274_09445 [Desulfobacterales bacterium]|nr:hypothetical protein [Desulfobacterales bacterium]
MIRKHSRYRGLISSDWNECLAPCGPFDFISFNHPQLTSDLDDIFKQYTANFISLGDAVRRLQQLLPDAPSIAQMDRYLDETFTTYRGVAELIQWCRSQKILFMINTTGMIGYFQRIFAKNLLPKVPLLSAHPMVRYPKCVTDPEHVYELLATTDKGTNTETVMREFNIPANKIVLMGDSGGDGPHFTWGTEMQAKLIATMPKPSLLRYCEQKNIRIDIRFGPSYADKETRDAVKEMQVDFLDLVPVIKDLIFGKKD